MYVKTLKSGQTSPDGSLCKEGSFLCAEKASGPIACAKPYFYEYGTGKCQGSEAAYMTMVSGLFFKPDELSAGKTIVYPKLDNDLQGRTFLPAELAKALPFSSAKLPSYLTLLDVPSGSNMAANMEQTVAFCNSKPVDGEIRTCHASVESMVDFTVSNMGPKVAVWSPAYSPSRSEEVRVLKAPVTLSSPEKKSITCHDVMYPYLVYGCHVMGSSLILDVELQRADGSAFHGTSVCHTDTSSWNPAHPAFAALNDQPGHGTVCHWVPQNNFVWVHA